MSGPQIVGVTVTPPGPVLWTVTTTDSNIVVSPTSGTGSGLIQVSAKGPGANGQVVIHAPEAAPLSVGVNVKIVTSSSATQPFGSFDTPLNNTSNIAGAIPVTGWALDNIEVTGVGIYREPIGNEPTQPNGLVYIGNGTFVAGARPDVQATYPNSPLNYRAGWGYMLLTNFLRNSDGSPGLGNGTYKLHAIATNKAGMILDLGTRTITVDNAHASKPFGTIDTPAQGDSVSGNAYVNFGWALTQNPFVIPADGSTLTVYIDGFAMGQPTYNQYRPDIAASFPGLANSNGAVGFFYLDTTQLTNGVHTIAWSASDNANRGDGIGSRYFTVQNTGTGSVAEPEGVVQAPPSGTVMLRRGFNVRRPPEPLAPDESGKYVIDIEELERMELQVGGTNGELLVNGEPHLPVGATIKDGVFYWQVGPGFLGEYDLLFERSDTTAVHVRVKIRPKVYAERESR